MSTLKEPMQSELKILFQALCDGLRQEVRQRHLANLVTKQDFSLAGKREADVASSLAFHLRLAGFIVQVDAYFPGGDTKRRPDFGIWLPAIRKYVYLELKTVAWGNTSRQYYFRPAIWDIQKLTAKKKFNEETDLGNGLIAVGFSNPGKKPSTRLLDMFKKLSQDIGKDYPLYEETGLECVNLQQIDEHSPYAVIGLWFRSYLN